MRALSITSLEQLRQVDQRAIITWERIMREQEGAAPSTVRRRLSALSSLFKHQVRHSSASRNSVARPAIKREEGTAAFSRAQARRLLDTPPADTVAGLRDRAILSAGLRDRSNGYAFALKPMALRLSTFTLTMLLSRIGS